MTIPVNPQLSFRWGLAAANKKHVLSMVKIGFAYLIGRGVEKNVESAFKWFKKAAKKGDKHAQFHLGRFYEAGIGHEIDLVKAMRWYQKSAAQEFQQAIDAVAHLNHNQLNE